MTLPTEFTLEIYLTEEGVVLPTFTGHISRALLLRMLRWLNPTLSEALHEPNVSKPYAVTPLYFKAQRREGNGYVPDITSPIKMKVRFLNDEASGPIIEYFTQKDTVNLQGHEAKIARIEVKTETYKEITNQSKPCRAMRVFFKTPTYLPSIGRPFYDLHPEPIKVFTNLYRLWLKFNPAVKSTKKGFEDYKNWLFTNVGITAHDLYTVAVPFGKKKATGFKGWVEYSLQELDDGNRLTVSLTRFARYSNIGGNRTGGFGVIAFAVQPAKKTLVNPLTTTTT